MYLCQPGGMVDAIDSKSIISDGVRVQVPWLVPIRYLLSLRVYNKEVLNTSLLIYVLVAQ